MIQCASGCPPVLPCPHLATFPWALSPWTEEQPSSAKVTIKCTVTMSLQNTLTVKLSLVGIHTCMFLKLFLYSVLSVFMNFRISTLKSSFVSKGLLFKCVSTGVFLYVLILCILNVSFAKSCSVL